MKLFFVVCDWFLCLCCLGQGSEQERLISSLQDLGLSGRSALEVYRSLSPSAKGDSDKAKNKGSKPGKNGKGGKGDKGKPSEGGANPVKTLQAVAKKLGLGNLSARWEAVCTTNTAPSDFKLSYSNSSLFFSFRLDGVKYENGKIVVTHKKTGNKPKFSQKKWCTSDLLHLKQ